MHLPWGMIFFARFQLYFPTFPSQLTTNSTFYQNKPHALRPCATNCHKILRTWCKNSIFCKTPNTLLQIQRAPTRARQRPSIPTVVATQSPTTKRTSTFAHFQLKTTPTYAPNRQLFPPLSTLFSHISKPTQHKFNFLPKPHPRVRQNNIFVYIFCFFSTKIKPTSTTFHLQCNSNQRQTAERFLQKTPTHFLHNSNLQQTHGPSGTPVPTMGGFCFVTRVRKLQQLKNLYLRTVGDAGPYKGTTKPNTPPQSPSRLRQQPPLHKGALVVYNFNTTKKQKSSSITMPNSFSQIFGQEIVGTGVPDGPSLLCLLPCLQIPPNVWQDCFQQNRLVEKKPTKNDNFQQFLRSFSH